MDNAIRYAKAYEKKFEQKLKQDSFLGPEFASIISGCRGLLNGDGAVAFEREAFTGDSKDNGVLESLYWGACKVSNG